MATQDEAQAAIFDSVVFIAGRAKQWDGSKGSAMLRDAAIAYRAAVGGPQPGNLVFDVES